jgi:hypothetical protein
MNQLIEKIFDGEITQQGLTHLQEKYPVGLKLEMSNDAVFKDARKTRTECNKMVEAIKRRRLDITGELKEYADEVTAEINRIYSVVVLPFEKEDKARKEKAAEEARKHQELIDSEIKKIKAIYEFVDDCRGKDSEHIQGIIEAVDLIETDVFDKDVIHEAIEAKKSTLHDLAQLLSDTISREKVEAEREVLRKQQAEAEELRVKEEKKRFIDQKISDLKMVPSNFFNKPSKEIQEKAKAFESYEITESVFGEKVEEAITTKINVIDTLNQMLENQLKIEAVELAETEKLEAEKKEADEVEEIQVVITSLEQKPQPEELVPEPKDIMQEDLKPEESTGMLCGTYEEEPQTLKSVNNDVIKRFLEWQITRTKGLNDFGYLLMSGDVRFVSDALNRIKTDLNTFTGN